MRSSDRKSPKRVNGRKVLTGDALARAMRDRFNSGIESRPDMLIAAGVLIGRVPPSPTDDQEREHQQREEQIRADRVKAELQRLSRLREQEGR
jgi:hypothetical protein